MKYVLGLLLLTLFATQAQARCRGAADCPTPENPSDTVPTSGPCVGIKHLRNTKGESGGEPGPPPSMTSTATSVEPSVKRALRALGTSGNPEVMRGIAAAISAVKDPQNYATFALQSNKQLEAVTWGWAPSAIVALSQLISEVEDGAPTHPLVVGVYESYLTVARAVAAGTPIPTVLAPALIRLSAALRNSAARAELLAGPGGGLVVSFAAVALVNGGMSVEKSKALIIAVKAMYDLT